MGINSAFEALI